jgi:fucose permease
MLASQPATMPTMAVMMSCCVFMFMGISFPGASQSASENRPRPPDPAIGV